MAVCANPACRRQLTEYQWGEGFCSYRCMADCGERGEPASETLHDPTGKMVIANNSVEVSALLECAAMDSRLPMIIILRRKKMTFRDIATRLHINASTCNRILRRATPSLLRECGLR